MLSRVAAPTLRAARVLGARKQAPLFAAPAAGLHVHEYVAMELMKKYGIETPRFAVVSDPDDAEKAFTSEMCGGEFADIVIKAQILAGGRGLGTFKDGLKGGVHVVTEPGQARKLASQMLNSVLVTKQTGDGGRPVDKVMLMERVYMRRELYFSITWDRVSGGPTIVASTRGGSSIEDVAAEFPELIHKVPVDIEEGLTAGQVEHLIASLGFKGEAAAQARSTFHNLYRMFIDTDATLVEINPLVETPDGRVLVCDAKLNFDDNSEFRQEAVFSLRDAAQEDPREVEASEFGLNYIGLDGDIGCMVNGAGLAMATMDIIKLHGGAPANFLDVGGGATEEQVAGAFSILNADSRVNAILVNIFGGIMRCDVIAMGIVRAASNLALKKPIVVRLQGTNVDAAREIIESSGFRMLMADDLDEAAEKAVKISNIVRQAEKINLGVTFELPL